MSYLGTFVEAYAARFSLVHFYIGVISTSSIFATNFETPS